MQKQKQHRDKDDQLTDGASPADAGRLYCTLAEVVTFTFSSV